MLRSKQTSSGAPAVIGWRERVSLPDLGIPEFVAKMDTGAHFCALHATEIKVEHGLVSFRFDTGQKLTAKLIGRKEITSSNGATQKRPLIRTRIKIGKKTINSLVTLVDRSKMKDKMLLGRKLLRQRFLIDPTLSYALSPSKQKHRPK